MVGSSLVFLCRPGADPRQLYSRGGGHVHGSAARLSYSVFQHLHSVPDRLAVAPRIAAAEAEPARRVDHDAVGMARELVPGTPAVQDVAAPLELGECRRGEAPLDVEQVARLAQRKAP